MLREQKIMNDVLNRIGEDKFNNYILTLNKNSLWVIVENIPIIDKTFEEIIEVFANYNLTRSEDILKDLYDLGNPDHLFDILNYLTNYYLKGGGSALLNRIMLFCFVLMRKSLETKLKPSDIIREIYSEKLLRYNTSFISRLKYLFKKSDYPYDIMIEDYKLILIAIVSGKSINETQEYLLNWEVGDVC